MPAHALLVHGAVVFGPVAGLLAVAYAVPALRERLRGVTLVTAVLAAVFVVLTYLSGDSYLEDNPALSNIPAVGTHEDRAVFALWVTLAFSALAVAATTLRTGRAALEHADNEHVVTRVKRDVVGEVASLTAADRRPRPTP